MAIAMAMATIPLFLSSHAFGSKGGASAISRSGSLT
jgi:hypothetical protein